jgi:hypothetical protein
MTARGPPGIATGLGIFADLPERIQCSQLGRYGIKLDTDGLTIHNGFVEFVGLVVIEVQLDEAQPARFAQNLRDVVGAVTLTCLDIEGIAVKVEYESNTADTYICSGGRDRLRVEGPGGRHACCFTSNES